MEQRCNNIPNEKNNLKKYYLNIFLVHINFMFVFIDLIVLLFLTKKIYHKPERFWCCASRTIA